MSLNAYDTFLGHPIEFPEKFTYIAQTPVWSDLLKGTQLVRDGTQPGAPASPAWKPLPVTTAHPASGPASKSLGTQEDAVVLRAIYHHLVCRKTT